ncbi:serine/threonine-protein kinase [Ramlibacter sp.]|uniref:serine/threonine-protein kinase n=1 Tax=Ramlibacter sp. TaxID=1917967 RepID=UPI002D0DB266|nr:serine/threonine-protein kinase [Ramlibacter sp.]HWI82056.1 serine/threonine-protein kinase [Ramlibacter sp.]
MSLRKLGRYDIVRVLGKGAMGIVYEGRDPNLDRRVAIKTVKVENLSPEAADEYEGRFRTEARSAARLQHPNIVSVYDSDRHEDVAYLVMEYIHGDDLKHHLDNGERYTLEQALRIIDDLLSALDYAHRQGIVHRDIKPANLLMEPGGRVKLTDFGVARIQDSQDATRTQGAMVGTLKYMSPEQVQGQKVDTRADLFSVGVLLYQLLTDQRPFDGENEFAIIHQIVGHTPPPPSAVNARLPAAIDAVVARALAKKPEQRYPTAAEFAAALRAAMRQAEDPTIVPPANPARAAAGGIYLVTSPGTSPMGNSTVTQELELVYWKDVKDSTDREDLEVFLAKFPAGIYADLARRRLRKLASEPAPDQTVLSGLPEAARAIAAGVAAARGGSDTMPLPRTTAAPARDASPARLAAEESFTPTMPDPRHAPVKAVDLSVSVANQRAATAAVDETTVPVGTAAPALDASADPPADAARAAAAAPAAARRPVPAPLLAGLGAVAIGALAALFLAGRGGNEVAVASPSGAASAPVAAPSDAASAALAAVSPAAASAAGPADATRRAAASAPHARPPASAARRPLPKAAAAAPAAEPLRPIQQASAPGPEAREPVRPAPAAVRPPANNPADVCKDKVFIALELCLAEQCDKAGARNHPLCVKRREDAKLREESRVRN